MFELDIAVLKEQGLQLVDSAKKTALELADKGKGLADKGKTQLEIANQQARLTKAQRQLGALVYSLHKTGEENQPLVDKYIETVAEIEKTIEDLKAQLTPAEAALYDEEKSAEETKLEEELKDVADELDDLSATFEGEVVEEEPIRPRGETKVCPVCQAEIDAEALFCTHCGAQL